jgi:DNA-binding MarR family transcriptional regulator
MQMLMALLAGPMTMGGLGKCLGIANPANCSTKAKKLELAGYLVRTQSSDSKRVVYASLTGTGLGVAERGMKMAKEGKA